MARPRHRLKQLQALFHEGTEATADQLAERLGCSSRQIRRLLDQLQGEGYPVKARRNGREVQYFVPEAHRAVQLHSVALEEQELLALMVAAEAVRGVLAPTPFGLPLQRAIGKLLEHTGETFWFDKETEPRHWHFGAGAVPRIDPDVLQRLYEAIRDARTVAIDYLTAKTGQHSTGRHIDPLMIAIRGTSWMVVAWCHQRRSVLDFALNGITRLESTGRQFSPPVNFDRQTYFDGRFRALAGPTLYQIRLRVEPNRAEYFRRTQYHPSQQLHEQPDGSLEVTFEATNVQEVRAFAQSWGTGVTVLAPPELVNIMAAEAAVLAERYKKK
jgi:predicted DNA-binding transcriptional regulator YafY